MYEGEGGRELGWGGCGRGCATMIDLEINNSLGKPMLPYMAVLCNRAAVTSLYGSEWEGYSSV